MTRKHARRPGPADVSRALDDLYAELPAMDCKGKCWDSCGPILMTAPEHERLKLAGYNVTPESYRRGPLVCPALTMWNRCGAYEVRPMICRLWGLVESMPCNFGCRPDGGLLPDEVGYELLARAHDIAGEHAEAASVREAIAQPAAFKALVRRQKDEMDLHREVRQRRAEASGTALYVLGRGRLTRNRTEQCGP